MQYYCERCGPGLFEEPINAFSNVVFLIAAWAGWRLARRRGVLSPGLWILFVLSACIGVGSGLWHTFATEWASLLDVIPISLFQLVFLWLYGRHAAKLPVAVVLGGIAVHVGVSQWLTNFDEWMNGGLVYLPTIALGVAVASHQYLSGGPVRVATAVSAVVFWAALLFRTLDMMVCRQLPIGTHFLWHVLNGVVVYLAMFTLVTTWAARRDGSPPSGAVH